MTRILSALILAPPVLAAVYFGSPWLDALVLLAAGVLAWEWSRICGANGTDLRSFLIIATVVGSVAAARLAGAPAAVAVATAGVLASAFAGARLGWQSLAWLLAGALYIAAACAALLWLHLSRPHGSAPLLFWLLLTVWATDSFAFLAGRAIGGPKLAPRISPRKTWAGLAGGVAAATVVGALAGLLVGPAGGWPALAVVGALLAIVAQGGDLAESAAKRKFGIKDASALIPGHGGLLDRVDGLMAAGLALTVLDWLGEAPF